jgi:voltage-gated potassium channel
MSKPGGPAAIPSARLEEYEHRTTVAVTVLAVVFIVGYAIPILWPALPHDLALTCEVVNDAIWVAFALDLLIRVRLAPRPWHYLLTHPLDVAVVVLPMLRPLRVLRVFAAGQALLNRGIRRPMLKITQTVTVTVAVLMLISALAVLDAERHVEDANITTFGDALWWAGTTVTTVGYGDRFPVSGTGRIVAAALMFVGISLLGVITATLASWFVTNARRAEEEAADLETRLAAIEAQLGELREMLARVPTDTSAGQHHGLPGS